MSYEQIFVLWDHCDLWPSNSSFVSILKKLPQGVPEISFIDITPQLQLSSVQRHKIFLCCQKRETLNSFTKMFLRKSKKKEDVFHLQDVYNCTPFRLIMKIIVICSLIFKSITNYQASLIKKTYRSGVKGEQCSEHLDLAWKKENTSEKCVIMMPACVRVRELKPHVVPSYAFIEWAVCLHDHCNLDFYLKHWLNCSVVLYSSSTYFYMRCRDTHTHSWSLCVQSSGVGMARCQAWRLLRCWNATRVVVALADSWTGTWRFTKETAMYFVKTHIILEKHACSMLCFLFTIHTMFTKQMNEMATQYNNQQTFVFG